MIRLQIDTVVKDIGVDAVKTGMLSSSAIVKEVASAARRQRLRLVVDPVMVSKSGASLLRSDAIGVLISCLLPLAEVVTPNLDEAEALTGSKVRSVEACKSAGLRILDMGPKAVVIKGGHLKGDAIDVLCQRGRSPIEFRGPRIASPTTHGTGCTFSSAIAAFLAMGMPLEEAVARAKDFVGNAIRYGLAIGKGAGPVDPTSNLRIDAEKYRVIQLLQDAISIMESSKTLSALTPECQINIVMALPKPYALNTELVCGVPGRFHNVGGRLRAASCPTFGASKHVARAVLAAMDFDPDVRAAMNMRCSKEILSVCRRLGFSIGSYDRAKEPAEIKAEEGATIPWGIHEATKRMGVVPDLIYHAGDWGKEPMITLFGRDPVEVVMKALKISHAIANAR
jgi:hydroxymethylpyrimidine/phosphomethylpyrimidine kinase